jgi:hypothetical protein
MPQNEINLKVQREVLPVGFMILVLKVFKTYSNLFVSDSG